MILKTNNLTTKITLKKKSNTDCIMLGIKYSWNCILVTFYFK